MKGENPDHAAGDNTTALIAGARAGHAEVVRMLSLLVGIERFLKGCRYFFDHYDGEAVTTDHFVDAVATAGASQHAEK